MSSKAAAEKAAELLRNVLPSARTKLEVLLRKRRSTFWGEEHLTLSIRDYPKSKEQTVSVVLPNFHKVELYSETLKRKVPLTLTNKMLRHIEDMGGLDAYLLNTPDQRLKSDTASALRWELMCAKLGAAAKAQAAAQAAAARSEAARKQAAAAAKGAAGAVTKG